MATTVKEPYDLIKCSLGERISVKCRGDHELRGVLHAYDEHLNMVLGEVDEIVTTKQINPATNEVCYPQTHRTIPMLFLRGDTVILVCPPPRTGA